MTLSIIIEMITLIIIIIVITLIFFTDINLQFSSIISSRLPSSILTLTLFYSVNIILLSSPLLPPTRLTSPISSPLPYHHHHHRIIIIIINPSYFYLRFSNDYDNDNEDNDNSKNTNNNPNNDTKS